MVLIAVSAATRGLPTGDLLALALLGTVATALSGMIGAILRGSGGSVASRPWG
ncbi:MAG: hypothetical protein U0232_13580 [Thermomicrobiales bacterium]